MSGVMEMETEGVWILGLDGQRAGRESIVRRIERESEGRVRVRDLAEPELRRWRAAILGAGSAPTLFEVNGDSVRAWEGWRMRLALGRVLGPSTTLRVMRDLKQEAVPPSSPVTRMDPRTLSRSRELEGPDLWSAVARAERNPDVRNLAGDLLSSPERLVAARPLAFEHVLRGGTRIHAAVFKLSVTRVLAHHLMVTPSSGRTRSTARLWQIVDGRSLLVGLSTGGAVQPPPHPADAVHHDEAPDNSTLCTAIDVSCVLNLAEAGGGRSTYFYTLPDTSVKPAPLGGACAGGYRKPSRRCCASFHRHPHDSRTTTCSSNES